MSANTYRLTQAVTIADRLPSAYGDRSDDDIIAEIEGCVAEALQRWHEQHPGVLSCPPA